MENLGCLVHPHHTTLVRSPYTLPSLFHSLFDRIDPYLDHERLLSQKGLVVPRFNVSETSTHYILDGEVPGVSDKSAISVAWLQNQVLMITGATQHADPNGAKQKSKTDRDTMSAEHTKPSPSGEMEPETNFTIEHSKETYPLALLNERHVGPFQRSFTFPGDVDGDNMKASLRDGLLRIVVPKMDQSIAVHKEIVVE